MPGIFGCAGLRLSNEQLVRTKQDFTAALQQLHPAERFTINSRIHGSCLVGSHNILPIAQQTNLVQHGNIVLALDGKLVERDSDDNPTGLIELFLQHGVRFADLLRGHLAMVIVDGDSGDIWLFTDHAASRPIYFTFQNDVLYFASDCVALSRTLPEPGDVNPHAVIDMLTFGYLTGVKTPLTGIECMVAGGYLHWKIGDKRPEVERYFVADNRPFESVGYQELRDELNGLFVQAVQRSLWSSSALFTLSGGLDSRAITATARQLAIAQPDCLIFGEAESMDVRLAQRVAKTLGAQPLFVDLNNGNYLIESFPAAANYNGGMVYYSGSAHMLHALQSIGAQRWDVVHTGMSGDMLMGSFLHAADITKPLSDGFAGMVDRVVGDYGDTSWIDLLAPHPETVRHGLRESVTSSLDLIREPEGPSVSQVLELWNLQNRQQRAMFNGFRQIENYAEFTSPFFDVDLFRFTLKIPHRYRLNEAMYVDMLSRLLPKEVWSIPWEKTGRPPSRRSWVNRLNKSSTLWRGRAIEFVFPQTFRKRSMNPFRVWLRDNQHLQRFVVEQLLAWVDMPAPLDPERVHGFASKIGDGRLGIGGRMSTIVFRLLTLSAWPSLYNFGQRKTDPNYEFTHGC